MRFNAIKPTFPYTDNNINIIRTETRSILFTHEIDYLIYIKVRKSKDGVILKPSLAWSIFME